MRIEWGKRGSVEIVACDASFLQLVVARNHKSSWEHNCEVGSSIKLLLQGNGKNVREKANIFKINNVHKIIQ